MRTDRARALSRLILLELPPARIIADLIVTYLVSSTILTLSRTLTGIEFSRVLVRAG